MLFAWCLGCRSVSMVGVGGETRWWHRSAGGAFRRYNGQQFDELNGDVNLREEITYYNNFRDAVVVGSVGCSRIMPTLQVARKRYIQGAQHDNDDQKTFHSPGWWGFLSSPDK